MCEHLQWKQAIESRRLRLGIVKTLPFELIQHQQTIKHEFFQTGHPLYSVLEGTDPSELYFFNNQIDFIKCNLTWSSQCFDREVEGWFNLRKSDLEVLSQIGVRNPSFKLCKATGRLFVLNMGRIVTFDHFENHWQREFGRYFHIQSGRTYWKFATEAMSPNIQPENETESSHFVYLFHNRSAIYRVGQSLSRVLTYTRLQTMPHVELGRNDIMGEFGAVASTSLYDFIGRLSAYVSVSENFSLLDFSAPGREMEQIHFNGGNYTGNDIHYMQCILDVSKNRRGIVVQRKNGTVELWDDRQPKFPSVTYISAKYGSDFYCSPHPPVVEWPMQSMIAACPSHCMSVLISRLETGEPINVLDYPDCCKYGRQRKIIFRSEWNFDRNSPSPPGPLFWLRPTFPRPTVPILPVRFYTDYTITYTTREDPGMPIPPWFDGIPPELPYTIGRGYAVYASDLDMMVENYTDYCVPIFLPNSDFPCVMLNYNRTAYLISPTLNGYGPCCVYRPNWSPPHRDFMRNFDQYYRGFTDALGEKRKVLNQTIDWWDIPLPESGKLRDHPVFGGFGFARKLLPSGYRPYVSFWYEGDIGWTHQVFENFTDTGPGIHLLDDFQLPDICKTNLACNFKP
nr:hypothetical protein HmN_000363300 [Hymenolepis microstoma]